MAARSAVQTHTINHSSTSAFKPINAPVVNSVKEYAKDYKSPFSPAELARWYKNVNPSNSTSEDQHTSAAFAVKAAKEADKCRVACERHLHRQLRQYVELLVDELVDMFRALDCSMTSAITTWLCAASRLSSVSTVASSLLEFLICSRSCLITFAGNKFRLMNCQPQPQPSSCMSAFLRPP